MEVNGFYPKALVFVSEKRCAFAAGKLIVEMDVDSKKQRFVQGHSASISCIAHSQQQALGASGQVLRPGAKWAEVLLWDSESLEICACFSFHQANVEAVGFIQDGEVLVSVGADRDRSMALWPAARDGCFRIGRKEGVPLAVCSAYKGGAIHGICAAPGTSDLPILFATYGVQHIKFWQSPRSGRLSQAIEGRRGAFGSEGVPKIILCAVWVARDRLVAGGNNGEVFFFHGSRAVRRIEPQAGSPVACLLPMRESLLVVHSNGMCHFLNAEKTKEVDFCSLPGWPQARFRTQLVSGAWKDRQLLLSSKTHLIFLDLSQGLPRVQCKALASQAANALTAVAHHPVEPRIYTAALDGLVRCYDLKDMTQLEHRSFHGSSHGVTCLAISGAATEESSAWLAVGCSDSTLSIMSENSYQYVLRRSLSGSKAKLTCAKFSSVDISGKHPLWLAVGTEDGCIHTFRFKEPCCFSSAYTGMHTGEEVVSKIATLRGHEAPIVDICFADTLPCNYLISVDLSGKELAFDVPMARRLPTMTMVREVPFNPWTLPVGWQLQGCKVDKKLPRVHEISGRSLIALATDVIEVFPFPCLSPPSIHPLRLEGPSAPISSLLFNPVNDTLLASSETALFVWSWDAEAQARPPLSPLRSVQESETPDSRKPKMPAFTPPPRPRAQVQQPQVNQSQTTAAKPAQGLFCQNCGQKQAEPAAQAPRTPLKATIKRPDSRVA